MMIRFKFTQVRRLLKALYVTNWLTFGISAPLGWYSWSAPVLLV